MSRGVANVVGDALHAYISGANRNFAHREDSNHTRRYFSSIAQTHISIERIQSALFLGLYDCVAASTDCNLDTHIKSQYNDGHLYRSRVKE